MFSIIDSKRKAPDEFSDHDWAHVSSMVPGRSAKQCQKRWLFTQKSKGKKLNWTWSQTDMLAEITPKYIVRDNIVDETEMPREWKKIAAEFF